MFSYSTDVKIDVDKLAEVVDELKLNYDLIGTRETHEGRSRFSQWNTSNKFLERLRSGEIESNDGVIKVVGSSKGGTSRIYFKPSVTSLPKNIRKCIVPVDENNIFAFFDIRAAEFAMTAIFAQEESIKAYHAGEDIYMYYANLFPPKTERKVIKHILIGNLYNKSAYSTSLDLGISETQAQRLLDSVALQMPKMTMFKKRVYAYDMKHNGYYSFDGFDQTKPIKVANIDPVKGFNPAFALSAATQSALGFFMQKATLSLRPRVNGTLLSVFDSMLVEIKPESKERFEKWVHQTMAPLIPDKITYGKTFWEAAYGEE